MSGELIGKTALITGASRGIGRATALHFAELGASVVVMARDAAQLEALVAEINAGGGEAIAVAGDVSDYATVEKGIAAVRDRRLDIVVNNAGLLEPVGHLADIPPADWAKVIDVNVKGVFNTAHAAIPGMLQGGGGTIINISSGAANNPLEGWSHYCASKAAAKMLTACLHKEYGARGIRAIGLSPGTVATDMQRTIKDSGMNPVAQMDWSDHIPPEWVAQGIAYLCGPGGDAWLGTDFSLKTDEGRAAAGLPAIGG